MSVVRPCGELAGDEVKLIDAAEFNNPTSDRDFGMQDVSKHYHLGSFRLARVLRDLFQQEESGYLQSSGNPEVCVKVESWVSTGTTLIGTPMIW